MASENTLVPLSNEELKTLANHAIEAKQKAYCEFSDMARIILLRYSAKIRPFAA